MNSDPSSIVSRRGFFRTAIPAAMIAQTVLENAGEAKSMGDIKFGAVDWEITKAADPDALPAAARLGFDGLQVDLGDVLSMKVPARQKLYSSIAARHKIEIASLALGILNEVPYASDDRAQGLVDAAIDIAAAMKQKVLLLAFFEKGDLNRPENREDALVAKLKEIAPKAERAGVVLGLEAEISVERYRRILDRTGSSAIKVYFDLVHAHTQGKSIYDEIASLGSRICEFHAKDFGNISFGQGAVDFPQVRRAIEAIGYSGWIHVEQWAEIKGDKPLGFDETHRRNLAYLRSIFG
jgi:L-ribulose-5-phosphate 3-epimerase